MRNSLINLQVKLDMSDFPSAFLSIGMAAATLAMSGNLDDTRLWLIAVANGFNWKFDANFTSFVGILSVPDAFCCWEILQLNLIHCRFYWKSLLQLLWLIFKNKIPFFVIFNFIIWIWLHSNNSWHSSFCQILMKQHQSSLKWVINK